MIAQRQVARVTVSSLIRMFSCQIRQCAHTWVTKLLGFTHFLLVMGFSIIIILSSFNLTSSADTSQTKWLLSMIATSFDSNKVVRSHWSFNITNLFILLSWLTWHFSGLNSTVLKTVSKVQSNYSIIDSDFHSSTEAHK